MMPKWWHPRRPFLADLVPWRHAAGVGVIRNHDQSLMRTYALRGPDLLGLSPPAQGSMMQALNNAFQRLPGHWSLHFEHQRARVTDYPPPDAAHPVLAVLEAQRRQDILDGQTYESRYYLTIRRQPVRPLVSTLGEVFMTRPPTRPLAPGLPPEVEAFRDQADHLAWLLRGVVTLCEPLRGADLLSYLHSTISDRWHRIAVPRSAVDLNWRLCDAPLIGGWEPRLGAWYLGLCSVLLFPAQSMAPLLARLDHLPFGHRRVTRWIAWHRQTARGVFRRAENVWLSLEKGALNEALGAAGHETRVVDSHATNQAMDADAARQEVSGAYVAYGHFTTTVMVWGRSPEEAEARIGTVQQIFEDDGFTAIIEREHSSQAFRSMLPGDIKSSVRRKPLSSLNVAHLAPGLKASWPGPLQDEHLQAPPWFLAHTEGTTLLRVVNHVRDVGHCAVLGPTGAGKSSFLSFTNWRWLLYRACHPGTRTVCLDIGRSARALTLCLGGQYDDLSNGSVQYQPLGPIDTPVGQRDALEWLLDRMADAQVPRTALTETVLRVCLERLAQAPASQRTLSELAIILTAHANDAQRGIAGATAGDDRGVATKMAAKWEVMSQYLEIKRVIMNLAATGLLNGHQDHFRETWMRTIELGTLLDETRLATALLPHLMQRLRSSFTGAPTLFQIDEAALVFALPKGEEEAKRDLRSFRKMNVSLMVFTHSLVDVFTSPIGSLLIESCPNLFLLANPSAQDPEIAKIYQGLGCHELEIREIASMRAQGEYYLRTTFQGIPRRRKFSVLFRGAVMACCGSSSPQDHDLMDRILADGHEPGPAFAREWFRRKGYPEAAASVGMEVAHAAD